MSEGTQLYTATGTARQERRKQRRKSALWPARLAASAGSFECHIQNLSLRGAMVQIDRSATVAGPVILTLDPTTEFMGIVKWQRNGYVGIRIKEQYSSSSHFPMPAVASQ